MSEPWLTVVTVVRNDDEALRRTIASVRSQRAAGVEHLIVDGASTDATRATALAAQRDDPAVRAVSEPDSGIYDAMNKGWALASGRLVQYLNAGDAYRSSDELRWVASRVRPDTDWLRTRVRFVDAAGRPTRPLAPAAIDAQGFRRGRQPVFHQGAFMSRPLLSRIGGFDTRFRIVADYDLMLRLLAAGVQPQVDERVTVNVDASGVSTRQWHRSLWESHVSRTSGSQGWGRTRSWAQTWTRVAAVGGRRVARTTARVLAGEERVSRWRAGVEEPPQPGTDQK